MLLILAKMPMHTGPYTKPGKLQSRHSKTVPRAAACAYLNGGGNQLRVTLGQAQEGEVHAGHDRRPHNLVCCGLQQHCCGALGVLRVHVLVQDLVPHVPDRPVKGQPVSTEPQAPAGANSTTELSPCVVRALQCATVQDKDMRIASYIAKMQGAEAAPHWVEGPALYPLRKEVAQHEAEQGGHCFGLHWVGLHLPAVVLPELPDLQPTS